MKARITLTLWNKEPLIVQTDAIAAVWNESRDGRRVTFVQVSDVLHQVQDDAQMVEAKRKEADDRELVRRQMEHA